MFHNVLTLTTVIHIQHLEPQFVLNHVLILTLVSHNNIYVNNIVNGHNLDILWVQGLVFTHALKDGLVEQDFVVKHALLELMETNKQISV